MADSIIKIVKGSQNRMITDKNYGSLVSSSNQKQSFQLRFSKTRCIKYGATYLMNFAK